MVRRLLLAAAPFVLMAGLAGHAAALPADDSIIEMRGPDAPRAAGPRIRLFISPMGEPFRGPDGFGTWFSGADTDHDGTLTPAEFRADGERFFRLLDTNSDGAIDGFEIQAYERERVPEIAGLNFDEGGRGGGGFRGGGRGRGGGRRGGGMGHGGESSAEGPQGGQAGGFRGAGADGTTRRSGASACWTRPRPAS